MKLLNVALFQIAFVALCVGFFLLSSDKEKIVLSNQVKEELVVYCDSSGNCNVSLSADGR